MKLIDLLYSNAARWPYVSWDEYYEDGSPASINWELVVNNLAQVDTRDLLNEGPAVIGVNETIPTPRQVG
jgi:hypothetical protein